LLYPVELEPRSAEGVEDAFALLQRVLVFL